MNSELRDARKMFAPEKTCTVYSLLVTHVKNYIYPCIISSGLVML